jgi:Ran GTPase-activating protein (RanGAP) involved in mRNA processing and transport
MKKTKEWWIEKIENFQAWEVDCNELKIQVLCKEFENWLQSVHEIPKIRKISIQRITLSRMKIEALAFHVSKNIDILELQLEKNNFGRCETHIFSGMKHLMKAFHCNTTITTLHLQYQSITRTNDVAEMLYQNKTLTSLNLSHNFIDDIALELLSNTLPSSNIKILDLSSNSISNTGARKLIQKCERMKMLSLSGNKLHTENIEESFIWGLLNKDLSSKVQDIDLSRTLLTDKEVQLLCRGSKCTSIDVSINRIDDVETLLKCISKNSSFLECFTCYNIGHFDVNRWSKNMKFIEAKLPQFQNWGYYSHGFEMSIPHNILDWKKKLLNFFDFKK